MKPLVIYHANCTDGFGAAFAAWLKLGDEAEYLPMNYGQGIVPTQIADNREVFILDFSFPRHVMEGLFAIAKRVVWLDHHKTAFEMWCGGVPSNGIFEATGTCVTGEGYTLLDNNKSGALLAWEYFHPSIEVPLLIQYIHDHDRGQFKLYGTKELHAALHSHKPWTFDQWWRFFYDKPGLGTYKRTDLIQEGAAIFRDHNQHVQACLKQARSCEIRWGEIFATADNTPAVRKGVEVGGYSKGFAETRTCLAANAPSFLASDLGHELANKSGTFGLVWSMAGDGQVRCSLRSNGEYDVSAIAKAFGGGGHRNAAGFSTNINTLMEWLKH